MKLPTTKLIDLAPEHFSTALRTVKYSLNLLRFAPLLVVPFYFSPSITLQLLQSSDLFLAHTYTIKTVILWMGIQNFNQFGPADEEDDLVNVHDATSSANDLDTLQSETASSPAVVQTTASSTTISRPVEQNDACSSGTSTADDLDADVSMDDASMEGETNRSIQDDGPPEEAPVNYVEMIAVAPANEGVRASSYVSMNVYHASCDSDSSTDSDSTESSGSDATSSSDSDSDNDY